MSSIVTETHQEVALIRLSNGVTNPIGLDLVLDLEQTLDRVKSSHQGLILSGGEKFFSIGFDLPGLLQLDRAGLEDFYSSFNRTLFKLLTLPLPTLCCITGHAVAGGCILSLGCDFRIAASEKTKIGLNEIGIGVPVPYLADMLLRQIIGHQAALKMMYSGDFISSAQAEALGLVDEILDRDQLEIRALEKIRRFSNAPSAAFAVIKSNRLESITKRFEKNFPDKLQAFLNIWFDPDTQTLLTRAAEKF